MDERLKHSNGITLVALVITIIILLILATISIQSLTNTGLFKNAQKAKEVTAEKTAEEKTILDSYEEEMGKATGAKEYIAAQTIAEAQTDDMLAKNVNSSITDAYGNKITVPAGFKIKVDATTNNATTVNQGIVIVDSNENEFVWIPVGKIYTDTAKTDANAKTIELNRYTFDTNGNPTAQGENVIGYFSETASKGNTVAKSIPDFKTSVATNGGYYIGRYEARQKNGKITLVNSDRVWNSITQLDAATQARNMYQNATTFTTDLMNSYSWDTAILLLQTCVINNKYSKQKSLNTSFLSTGTTNDIQCNVYDMASNVREWSTETSSHSGDASVTRGGGYNLLDFCADHRNVCNILDKNGNIGFRPLLYVNV